MPLTANQSYIFTPRESLLSKLNLSVANRQLYMILLSGIRLTDTTSVWDALYTGDTRTVLEQVTKADVLGYELQSVNGYSRSLLTFGAAYWDATADMAKLPRTQGSFTLTADGTSYDAIAILENPGTSKSSATISVDASTDTVTATAHGLANNDYIMVEGATIPGGLANNVLYQAINITTNTFKISSNGTTAIDITSAGSNCFIRYANGTLGSPILIAPYASSLFGGIATNIPLDIAEADMNPTTGVKQ